SPGLASAPHPACVTSLRAHLAWLPCRPCLHDCRQRLLLDRHRLPEAALRALLHPPGEPPHPLRRLHPESGTQHARNLTWELTELGRRPRFLTRDRDAKFAAAFDSVFAAEATKVRRTPPRSPQANSIAERWVASARREALDWLLVLNDRHLRRILKEYVEH